MEFPIRYEIGGSLRSFQLLLLAGAGVTVAGLLLEPARVWPNMLLAAMYVIGLGLAAVVFVAFVALSNAGWATAFRRVPEALSVNVYLGSALTLLVLGGIHHLYEWSHEGAIAAEPLQRFKATWLSTTFFVLRTVMYLGIWGVCTWLIVRTSMKQDETGAVALTQRNRVLAGVFTAIFALTFWVASMDWIMSLEPHWYSTIFGVYHFSGMFLTGIAAITVTVILLRRGGYLREFVREDHLHDLGKMMFAFSTFWMYIWFSQYLLIWYANIPEETSYYIRRQSAGWEVFMVLNLVFNWVIPFFVLLSRSAKRNEGLLLKVGIVVLVGHWIDLYWMILPPFMPAAPVVGVWEIGPVALGVALVVLGTRATFFRGNIVPVKDPMLIESLHYHQ